MDSEIIFDDQGRPMRRVRRVKKVSQESTNGEAPEVSQVNSTSQGQKGNTLEDEAKIFRQLQAESAVLDAENARRPCPVPKPTGAIGRLLGFEEKGDQP